MSIELKTELKKGYYILNKDYSTKEYYKNFYESLLNYSYLSKMGSYILASCDGYKNITIHMYY